MAPDTPDFPSFSDLSAALIAVGQRFDAQGWVPASSGNFSARLAADRLAITASGRHKGELLPVDILQIDLAGQVEGGGRASYETGLHTQLYQRDAGIGAVLHSHSVAGTLLSRLQPAGLRLQGYELLKLFDGFSEPQQSLQLPVFPNEQDIGALAQRVEAYMGEHGTGHAYLIKGHGLYTWAADVYTARLRVEALEFMLACELQLQGPSQQEKSL